MDPSSGVHESLRQRWLDFNWDSYDRKKTLVFVLILSLPFLLLGVSVLGLMALFIPIGMGIRSLEDKLHPLYALVLCIVNVASLVDISSDIIVSAEGILVLLGVGPRDDHEQYVLLARLVFVFISVAPYFLVYVIWALSSSDRRKGSILKAFLIFLLFTILWKVALLVCRLFIIFKILASVGVSCSPLDNNTRKQVEWGQFMLVGDIIWSSVPLAILTCVQLYYDSHSFSFAISFPAFEIAKLIGLGVAGFGVVHIFYVVALFNWRSGANDPENPRTHLQ